MGTDLIVSNEALSATTTLPKVTTKTGQMILFECIVQKKKLGVLVERWRRDGCTIVVECLDKRNVGMTRRAWLLDWVGLLMLRFGDDSHYV